MYIKGPAFLEDWSRDCISSFILHVNECVENGENIVVIELSGQLLSLFHLLVNETGSGAFHNFYPFC
jgi:hypothetical protein